MEKIARLKFRILVRITMQFMLLLVLALSSAQLYAQDEVFIPSKDKAQEYFVAGNFSEALTHYRALAQKFARDPVYKYYCGACLVELGQDIDGAIEILEESRNESSSLRAVPDKSLYYLGKAYQNDKEFDKAIEYYDSFRDRVRKKEAKEYKLDELIEQCNQGQVSEFKAEPESTEMAANIPSAKIQADPIPEIVEVKQESEPELTGDDYDSIAKLGLEYQFAADSLSRVVSRYRATLKSLSGNDRASINKKILDLESDIFSFQSKADKKFAEAASYNRMLYDGEREEEFSPDPAPDVSSIELISDSPDTKQQSDSLIVDSLTIEKEKPLPIAVAEPILQIFNPSTRPGGSIPVNDTLPDGLYYRIQMAAFRNPIEVSYFKNLGPVYGIKASDSEITFYFVGMFRRKEDADKAVSKVRGAGFKDAFVVAVFEDKRISLERSAVLEKDWADRSLFKTEHAVKVKRQDEALTLVFRVEADRSEKEFEEEKIETLKLVAGNRELNIRQNEDEEYVCLIGKFLTFESAQVYADLLFRNGLKEARVAAYMGNREIPLKTARELFDLNNKK